MTTFDNAITRRQVAYPRYAKYLDRFAPLTVASVALAFAAILSMVAFVASDKSFSLRVVRSCWLPLSSPHQCG